MSQNSVPQPVLCTGATLPAFIFQFRRAFALCGCRCMPPPSVFTNHFLKKHIFFLTASRIPHCHFAEHKFVICLRPARERREGSREGEQKRKARERRSRRRSEEGLDWKGPASQRMESRNAEGKKKTSLSTLGLHFLCHALPVMPSLKSLLSAAFQV